MEKKEATKELQKSESKGFNAIRGGSGLSEGNYILTTDENKDIFLVKEVSANSGKKFALTMLACRVTGADAENSQISVAFGIGERDRQLVLSATDWAEIDINQAYDLKVNAKGRVESVLLAKEQIVETSDIVTKIKKEKVIS